MTKAEVVARQRNVKIIKEPVLVFFRCLKANYGTVIAEKAVYEIEMIFCF